ncbi:hypothetical protein AX16_003397 [Volvariella volvacea WC 439]|nr:hypothetical protein AX16_003397 [Volvariella volvacea WC 439]
MSRLLIKNLPPYVTPERLREHFEQKRGPGGVLTDCKVAFKRDGTSRRFGFVGYKTEQQAAAAREYFDKTFIDSARISVTVVDGAKDAPTPRPNKRPRLGPSPHEDASMTQKSTLKAKADAVESEKPKKASQLDRFMEVMQPRNKNGPSWANDDQPVAQAKHVNAPPPPAAPEPEQALEEVPEPSMEGLSDMEWMKRHMSSKVEAEDKAFEQSDDEMDVDERPAEEVAEPEPPKDPTKETIRQTARLFLRNLAFSCTTEDLTELFQRYGELIQVHIPLDNTTKQPKGLAYVTFAKADDAVAAYEALDKKSFQGRLLHIMAAVDRRGNIQVEEGEGRKKTLKEERQAKRKSAATKEFNWSMLYMNADAVASSIADRMNIPKSDILNPESGSSAAVKLALAETHIIQETKAYLESEGVLLSSFASKARSDTTILVKNIPYGTTADQIREMFAVHGELSRVLVPPAGTIAVVEFDKPDEAAKAFKAVAYRRLGNSIIYLEKGPLGIFSGDASAKPSTPSAPVQYSAKPIKILEQEIGESATAADEEEPSINGGTTLFVKNLSFATSQERFAQTFRALPSFSFARIQTKPDPKRLDGQRLSMGYGFVGFKDVEGAKKALKSMQGFVLDGHALHVKFAGRGTEEDKKGAGGAGGGGAKSAKMIVKNVPFEATKKDLRELFGAHGHLKSVRLPKKFDSRTRGFAFLEFISRQEAENAYATLRHTHLLGRHLVLEWAQEGEQDVEELRKKAGVGFGDGKALPWKKRKIDMGRDKEGDDNEPYE